VRDAGAGISPIVKGISSAGDAHFVSRSECVTALLATFPPLPTRSLSSHRWPLLLRLSPVFDQVCSWFLFKGQQRHCVCALARG
jgi:hypothetical protein